MAAQMETLLDDLQAETDEVAGIVEQAGPLGEVLPRPTPAAGWSVGDTVGHLWFFDREARRAAETPEEFRETLHQVLTDGEGYMARALDAATDLGARILPAWRNERAALIASYRSMDPATRIPWYGPDMSPASAATARLMETWAHGQDIADGLGVRRVPTDRLRHICFLGVRTRQFSYAVRGLPAPDGDVRVELTPPSGDAPWTWGPDDATDVVRGPALDFCLLVTQRRVLADLSLTATGDIAADWLQHAQAFAGLASETDPGRAGLPV